MDSLKDLLGSDNAQLGKLLRRSTLLDQLNAIIREALPPDMTCYVSNIKSGKLHLATSNPAQLTRLRYESPQLLSELRKHPQFAQLTGIVCKIQPELSTPQTTTEKTTRRTSTTAKTALKNIMDTLKED